MFNANTVDKLSLLSAVSETNAIEKYLFYGIAKEVYFVTEIQKKLNKRWFKQYRKNIDIQPT